MTEYIEREALVMEILGLTIMDSAVAAYADAVLDRIQRIPAADVAPVVHGKAIYRNRPEHHISYKISGLTEGGDLLYKREHRILENNPVGYCSDCGKRLCSRFANYCPSCGAKMEVK